MSRYALNCCSDLRRLSPSLPEIWPNRSWSSETRGRRSTSLSRNATPSSDVHSRSTNGSVVPRGPYGTQRPIALSAARSNSAGRCAFPDPSPTRRPSPLGPTTGRPSRFANVCRSRVRCANGTASSTGTLFGSFANSGSAASTSASVSVSSTRSSGRRKPPGSPSAATTNVSSGHDASSSDTVLAGVPGRTAVTRTRSGDTRFTGSRVQFRPWAPPDGPAITVRGDSVGSEAPANTPEAGGTGAVEEESDGSAGGAKVSGSSVSAGRDDVDRSARAGSDKGCPPNRPERVGRAGAEDMEPRRDGPSPMPSIRRPVASALARPGSPAHAWLCRRACSASSCRTAVRSRSIPWSSAWIVSRTLVSRRRSSSACRTARSARATASSARVSSRSRVFSRSRASTRPVRSPSAFSRAVVIASWYR